MYTMAQAPSKDLHKPTALPISTVTCHDPLQAKNTDRTDFTYNPTQSMLRPLVITQLLLLPWARKQVISSFLAQGRHRS